MTANVIHQSKLRYLSSACLEAPFACDHVDVWDRQAESIGALDGVIVDPDTHRLRYLVVVTHRLLGHYRFLVPFLSTQIDMEHHALRVDVDGTALGECEPFDPRAFAAFA